MFNMKWIFMFIIILSPMIAYSSESWFQLWISLEINMMAFTPLMFNNSNTSVKSMMKYFIIQSFASSLILMGFLFNFKNLNYFLSFEMVNLALLTKLGMFPLFFWFIEVSEGLSWFSFTLLSTWQKLIPFVIFSSSESFILLVSIFLSAWIGCIGLFNQMSLRKILAYSSINNMSWMGISILMNNNGWFFYWVTYSLLIMFLYMTFNTSNISSINHLMMKNNKIFSFSILTILLSLGGLPPLLGFIPKWLIISSYFNSFIFLMFNLIFTSMLSMFIYLRIMYPHMLLVSPIKIKYESKFFYSIFINSIMFFPIIPLILV